MSGDLASVGVVIPAYNCEQYIGEALESLEQQRLRPDHVVVVDDGSTDKTREIVARFQTRSDLRISCITQANQGIAAARNVGVARCDTAYIAFLDGDDAFYPSFLEQARQALRDHPELALCFSDRHVVDAHRKLIRLDLDEPKFRSLAADKLSDDVSVLRTNPFSTLVAGNVVPIGNLMLRKKTFYAVDGFDADLRAVEDRPFLLNMTKLGAFGFLDKPLGIWRRHDSNTSGASGAFKMVYYADLALRKLMSQTGRLKLTENERQAVVAEQMALPAQMLYAAACNPNAGFPSVALALARTRRAGALLLLKSTARYLWLGLQRRRAMPQ